MFYPLTHPLCHLTSDFFFPHLFLIKKKKKNLKIIGYFKLCHLNLL